jgi:uncharacterized protein
MKMNWIDFTALALVVIGALNWGLVGAFEFNLVDALFGADSMLSRIVYVLVGIAGLAAAFTLVKAVRASRSGS